MDKAAYCDDMNERLRGLATLLERRSVSPPPSTAEASQQQAGREVVARRLQSKIGEALQQLEALRISTDPAWESARQDLDRCWQEITNLKREMEAPP
jgi:hypothetical protein